MSNILTKYDLDAIADHADVTFHSNHPGNEKMVAVYGVTLSEKHGELFIAEYEDGTFWTVCCELDECGTLTKCIEFLIEYFK